MIDPPGLQGGQREMHGSRVDGVDVGDDFLADVFRCAAICPARLIYHRTYPIAGLVLSPSARPERERHAEAGGGDVDFLYRERHAAAPLQTLETLGGFPPSAHSLSDVERAALGGQPSAIVAC